MKMAWGRIQEYLENGLRDGPRDMVESSICIMGSQN